MGVMEEGNRVKEGIETGMEGLEEVRGGEK